MYYINQLEYKGHIAHIHFSSEDKILYGKLEGINDLVNFESNSASDIENQFHIAVDNYLEMCKKHNKKPEVPYDFSNILKPSFVRPTDKMLEKVDKYLENNGLKLYYKVWDEEGNSSRIHTDEIFPLAVKYIPVDLKKNPLQCCEIWTEGAEKLLLYHCSKRYQGLYKTTMKKMKIIKEKMNVRGDW